MFSVLDFRVVVIQLVFCLLNFKQTLLSSQINTTVIQKVSYDEDYKAVM